MDWLDDGHTMLHIDSDAHRIDRYDVDVEAGRISGRSTFVEFDPAIGLPDGMTVDSENGVWLAFFGSGQVRRYDGGGNEDIRTPSRFRARRVSCSAGATCATCSSRRPATGSPPRRRPCSRWPVRCCGSGSRCLVARSSGSAAEGRRAREAGPEFEGRVALVTGAGSGIGAQIARDLARGGAHVIATDRRVDRLEAASRPGATRDAAPSSTHSTSPTALPSSRWWPTSSSGTGASTSS